MCVYNKTKFGRKVVTDLTPKLTEFSKYVLCVAYIAVLTFDTVVLCW